MAKFCMKCGKSQPDDAKFCNECSFAFPNVPPLTLRKTHVTWRWGLFGVIAIVIGVLYGIAILIGNPVSQLLIGLGNAEAISTATSIVPQETRSLTRTSTPEVGIPSAPVSSSNIKTPLKLAVSILNERTGLSVRDASKRNVYATGMFLVLDVRLKNWSYSPTVIRGTDIMLADNQGRKFWISPDASIAAATGDVPKAL
jgi:hypothetical protein